MKSFAVLVLLACAFAPLPAARAQTNTNAPQTVYTVEIIVFRNTSGAGGQEDWGAKAVARGPDTPDELFTGRFVRPVPVSEFQLNDIEARLRNTANYPPIAHFAWQQTASSWGSRAGFTVAKLGGNVQGLSGTIYLERGTYLHLGMALDYQSPSPPDALGAAAGQSFNMRESRRVKFFERNYFDHPAFGVIALVTPSKPSTGGR